ncbi:helix-turn-helix domain-containing protein [Mucilaginibacter sabulilitoris]|uniref:Helix-turn-helix domain-containing protein n=1 Tax=Mucilaginibacter sabulilitoris TaxID=1173583 RepID=A0ABZ0TV64_9SPHI|nr:helix-turn-helix domain-containing protein [Mucilaginibacter sabulilitoris]WPU96988.1 helix-turn-helix domain-containing protein [Mucilaginibacter sabulilitoris]
MNNQLKIELVNPQTNILAFRLIRFNDDAYFKSIKSFNCYKVILIREGKGQLTFNRAKYDFSENCLIRFPIYQPFQIETDGPVDGTLIQFHPDFFWNHKYDMELTSKQVLFKSIGEIPLIKISKEEMEQLLFPLDHLLLELTDDRLGRYDIAISWVKIFMIYASRIKMERGTIPSETLSEIHYNIRELINAVEEHFHHKHRPANYAKLLNVTVKTLNRMSKQHLEKTVGDMISERIITQAKHELYLSDKPIKQIALELGFHDVAYFSRFFKIRTTVPPDVYRKSFRDDID